MSKALRGLSIGNLMARVPIIQGGMGVGISLSGLAAATANAGGVGVIAAAGHWTARARRLQRLPRRERPGTAQGDSQGQRAREGRSPRRQHHGRPLELR